jgi:hypothetical protein
MALRNEFLLVPDNNQTVVTGNAGGVFLIWLSKYYIIALGCFD